MTTNGAIGIGLIVLSPLLAYGSFMAWTGRWRSWTGELILGPQALPITMMPAMSVFFLGIGLSMVGALSSSSPFAAMALLAAFAGLLLSFFTPRWWGPRWYREAERPLRPNMKDPLTALAVASDLPAPISRPLPPQFTGRPIDSWGGNFVERDEKGMSTPFTRKGKVHGRLNLYEAGVSFVAGNLGSRLEDRPFDPIVVHAGDVLEVRVVPAGAGPDGRKRRGTGLRSLFKRLVIDTPEGPLLFEVQRAEVVQREIRDAM